MGACACVSLGSYECEYVSVWVVVSACEYVSGRTVGGGEGMPALS